MTSGFIVNSKYEYWHRNEDLWMCTGKLLEDYMKGFVKKPEC